MSKTILMCHFELIKNFRNIGLAKFYFLFSTRNIEGLPGGLVVKNLLANAGDAGSVSGSGRSLQRRNGNPF